MGNAAAWAKTANSAYGNALNTRLTKIGSVKYGDKALFDSAYTFRVGMDSDQDIVVNFTAPSAVTVNVGTTLPNDLDSNIETLAKAQGKTGGYVNALGYIADGTASDSAAMWTAYSTFAETNIASEMSKYVKNSVLNQSAQLILSQYNQNAYAVLNLLKQAAAQGLTFQREFKQKTKRILPSSEGFFFI